MLNQVGYIKKGYWALVCTDAISSVLILFSAFFFIKRRISIEVSAGIYSYTLFCNLSVSNWFYFYNHDSFAYNFLFSTFIYAINMVVAGFCIHPKHAYISACIYLATFGSLIFISKDIFLLQNAIAILFLIPTFAAGIVAFLNLIEKARREELALKDELFQKDKALVEKQNRLLNFQLEAKQKVIVAKSMFLLEHAENNSKLIKKLKDIRLVHQNIDSAKLDQLINDHTLEHYEKYWKDFESSFMEIQPEFYKKLHNACPSLSPAELKIAALIHIGLTSKQISNITSNTPESVDVARSRIRSKLNLPGEANLKTYLLNL